jgi:hypothetical protein
MTDHTPAPKAIEALPELPDAPDYYNREGAQIWQYGYRAALAAAQAEQDKPKPEEFDVWMQNPYTKVLMKSIKEDYRPRYPDMSEQPSPPSDRGPAGAPPPVEQDALIRELLDDMEGVPNLAADPDAWEAVRDFARAIAPPQADRADAEALLVAVDRILQQVDEGPRGCYGKDSGGREDWKGSFHERIETLRAARATQEPKP